MFWKPDQVRTPLHGIGLNIPTPNVAPIQLVRCVMSVRNARRLSIARNMLYELQNGGTGNFVGMA